MEISKQVAEKLKLLRKSHGLSQRELSMRVGLSRGYYCDIENEKRPLSKGYAEALSAFYNEPIEKILKGGISEDDEVLLQQIDEHADELIDYFIDKKIKALISITGMDHNLANILEILKFKMSVFETPVIIKSGDAGFKYMMKEIFGEDEAEMEDVKNTNELDDFIICSIRRTNSPDVHFSRNDISKMQKEIFEYIEFIVKRYMKVNQNKDWGL